MLKQETVGPDCQVAQITFYRLVQYGSHLSTCPNTFRYCTVNCIHV